MSPDTQKDVHVAKPSQTVSLEKDEEEFIIPMLGTVVAFSLSVERIVDCYTDPIIQEAIRRFQPKKYMGIFRYASEMSDRADYSLELFHIATRSVDEDYARLDIGFEKPSWYDGLHVKMGTEYTLPDNGRPAISCSPAFPWNNCVVYTSAGSIVEMGKLHTVEGDPCRATREDYHRLMGYFREDFDNLSKRREQEIEEGQASNTQATREAVDLNQPARVPTLLSGQLPPVPIVVDMWEDFSDVTEALYPGDFNKECEELKVLINDAVETAIQRQLSELLPGVEWHFSDVADLPALIAGMGVSDEGSEGSDDGVDSSDEGANESHPSDGLVLLLNVPVYGGEVLDVLKDASAEQVVVVWR